MDPSLQELLTEVTDPDEELEVLMRLVLPNAIPEKVRLIAQFGDVITCRIKRKDIDEVYRSPLKFSMKAAKYFSQGSVTTAAPPGRTDRITITPPSSSSSRRPVVLGIIDWGCDFTHENFRNADGTTRLLALWDQSSKASNQSLYGYGMAYFAAELNNALQSAAPFDALKYHPAKADPAGIGAHGTHVMDIAGGNGRVGRQGIAPNAQLAFVHLSAGDTSGVGTLGDSVRILEAIDFLRNVAGDRPLVINMSVGRHGGPHDGETLVERAIDNFLESRDDTMLCQSTGNYFKSETHACGMVRAGKSTRLAFIVDEADKTPNELEIWYSGKDVFHFILKNAEVSVEVPLGKAKDIIVNDELIGRVYHRKRDPVNRKNHINVFLYTNAKKGTWEFYLSGVVIADGRFHSWIERDSGCRTCQAKFLSSCVTTQGTTGTICNGFNSIAVGAYNDHVMNFEFGDFSSQGPTIDGRYKPDLVAPGVKIIAARSANKNEKRSSNGLTSMSGTSMAAPHVSGTVARVLEILPQGTPYNVIRNIINGSTDKPQTEMKYRIGNGVLNTKKAIQLAEIYKRSVHAASKV